MPIEEYVQLTRRNCCRRVHHMGGKHRTLCTYSPPTLTGASH